MKPQVPQEAVSRQRPKIRAFIGRRVRCPADAEDLTQETFAKALRRVDTLRDATKLEAWLYRIARSVVIDHYRRRRPAATLGEEAGVTGDDRAARVMSAVAAAAKCYLGTLPEDYRLAVQMAEFDGVPHAEVAKALGISLTAAKSRVRRGKQRIRELMERCCVMQFDRRGRVVDYVRRDGQPCRLDRE